MIVADIMSTRVVTVDMDVSLEEIRDLFRQAHFHHLLVEEEGELVGVISDRDLFLHLSPYLGTMAETVRDETDLRKRAHQIMTRKPVTISKGETVEAAARLLLEKKLSCLPVVGKKRNIEGILSWRDILRATVLGPSAY